MKNYKKLFWWLILFWLLAIIAIGTAVASEKQFCFMTTENMTERFINEPVVIEDHGNWYEALFIDGQSLTKSPMLSDTKKEGSILFGYDGSVQYSKGLSSKYRGLYDIRFMDGSNKRIFFSCRKGTKI